MGPRSRDVAEPNGLLPIKIEVRQSRLNQTRIAAGSLSMRRDSEGSRLECVRNYCFVIDLSLTSHANLSRYTFEESPTRRSIV